MSNEDLPELSEPFPEIRVGVVAARTFYLDNSYLIPVHVADTSSSKKSLSPIDEKIRDTWKSANAIAVCAKQGPDHQIPDEKCMCGIYSFITAQEVISQYQAAAAHAIAAIAPAGRSFEGSRGWKSEAAQVLGLWIRPSALKYNPDIAKNYPTVQLFDKVGDLFRAYPSIDNGGVERFKELVPAFIREFYRNQDI